MTKEIAAILAVGPYNIIGKKDKLVWHSKQDFKHFQNLTKGWPCLFGATTFFGLPTYPLKNRLNIVLDINNYQSHTLLKGSGSGGWIECNDINTALEICKNYDKIFICGGRSVYDYVYKNNIINTIYLSRIVTPELKDLTLEQQKEYVKLDTINFDMFENKGWVCTQESEASVSEEGIDSLKFYKYIRINNA